MSRLGRIYRRVVFGQPVVVVSGLPRSGTSMMMKMLEAGGIPVLQDGIRASDDHNPKGYYELERVKDLDKNVDKSWVREGRGRAVKVISSLLQHLPAGNNYHVIFMQRHLEEVLASQTKMLAQRNEPGGSADDEALARFYETHLWRVKYFLRNHPAFSPLMIEYSDVVSNAESASHRIRAFLGKPLHVNRMVGVVDRELYRNRAVR